MAKQICSVNRFALLLMVCTICAVTAPVFADDTGTGPVSVALPFIFIENQGKYPLEVKYYTETADKVFFFTDNGTVISGVMDEDTGGDLLFGSVNMNLAGKRPDASVVGVEKSDGVINYLLGSDPKAWMTDVPAYTKILYSDLYPGIDLSLSGKDGLIKREYILDAYADPGLIRMQYSGADGISLGSDGSLIVNTPFGPVYEQAPRSYQIEDGEEQTVASAFVILDEETVGFLVGAYDETKELIIDPYIAYSSYLGGTYEDQGFGIAADDNGNAYICGYTASCNFPNTTTPCINPLLSPNYRGGRTLNGTTDAFVTKIHQAGSANATLEFSTYLGGNNLDFGRGIDIDIAGNMYVCGNTFSTDFPVKNAWSYGLSNGGALAGQDDAFVTKLHRTGTYIVYSSYIGGEGSDRANAIAVHTDGSAYITGETTGNFQFKAPETRYPVTSGAYQEVPNPDALMGDAFATKLNPNGNLLTYSTYISGHSNDVGNGIAVDDFGYAYIVGSTVSSNLVPAGVPGKYKTLQGGGDAFIFKMNFAGGNPVSYASYLGGKTGWDYGTAVAVDAEGCAYMTGATASTDFPMEKPKQSTKGYPQDNFDKDAFVTKFASDGDSLEYSTYLGGSKEDYGLGIAVDDLDRAYVTGYTKSSGFPKYLSLKYTNNGNQEVFVTCYQPDMRYFEYSTTFGGYYDDVGAAVAVDSGYSAYIAGYTKSPSEYQCDPTTCPDTFPVRLWLDDTYVGNNLTGNYDAFITKLGHSSITVDFVANETIIQEEDWVLFTDLSTYSDEIDWWFWDFGDGNTESSSIQYNPEHQYNTSGIYDVTLTLNPVYGSEVSKTRTQYIRVCGTPPVVNFTVQGFPQATEPVNISVNTAKTFLANITPSQAMSSYQWNFEDGTGNATTANPSHTFTVPGAYNVTLTVTDACGTGISTQRTANGLGYVHVYAPPYVAFNGTPREL
ncbi:MAG: SBBP repeat-containing protein, partial [Methanospirillaceae archaeon]|nr:SBBP repeat-containing protein [Methanospirillaceae archaeon]